MKTRIRRKACPFCRCSPKYCYPLAEPGKIAIQCSQCGSRGPAATVTGLVGDSVVSDAWIKWSARGT
jgi:hypothetical protein